MAFHAYNGYVAGQRMIRTESSVNIFISGEMTTSLYYARSDISTCFVDERPLSGGIVARSSSRRQIPAGQFALILSHEDGDVWRPGWVSRVVLLFSNLKNLKLLGYDLANKIQAHSGRRSATTLNASLNPKRDGLQYCGNWRGQRVIDRYVEGESLLDSSPCMVSGTMGPTEQDRRLRNVYVSQRGKQTATLTG